MSEIRSVTQIPGVYAGHATMAEAGTGCTVIIVPDGAMGGVDVRSGAPASRETDLLRPEETVETVVHGVEFCRVEVDILVFAHIRCTSACKGNIIYLFMQFF